MSSSLNLQASQKHPSRKGFRNVVALGAVSFFTDVSTEMVLGLLPVFIVEELKASRAILGLIDGVADCISYILRVFSGVISDVLRARKPIVLLGYTISNLAKPTFAFAKTWIHAFSIRVVDRVGKGVRTSARDALIADSVSEGEYGRAFGLHRTLDQVGAVVGPGLAALLLPFLGFRKVFLLSLIPGLAALMVLTLMVSEVKPSGEVSKPIEGLSKALSGDFKLLLTAVTLYSLGAYSFSFMLLKSREAGVSAVAVPLVYALINIAHVASAMPAGILSDKAGAIRMLAASYMTFAIASAIAGYAGMSISAMLASAAIYGAYAGMAETAHRAAIAELSPHELKATAYGILYLVIGLASFAANTIFGFIWDHYGAKIAFTYSLALALASLPALAALQLKRARRLQPA